MLTRKNVLLVSLMAIIILAGCKPPQPLPGGPTPIPTLIPATISARGLEPTATPPPVVESYPVGLPGAADGQALYAEHCAECHGPDGKGVVPNARDFSDVDYMRGETPVAFYTVITEGRGEGENAMPAFGDALTSDQRWDLVYYIWRFSATDESLLAGQDIYSSTCKDCHGPTGRSQILGAADFSDQRFLTNRSPSDLFVSVTQGKGSMPAWQARLSQGDRWAVIDFVRTFTYDPVLPVEMAEEGGETAVFAPEPTPTPDKPPCDPAYLAQTNPFAWDDAEAIAAGELLYQDQCTRCHGEDGRGEAGLSYIPADLTSPEVQNTLQENSGEYLCRLVEGLGEMPSFKRQISEEEMWQALTYVATFER